MAQHGPIYNEPIYLYRLNIISGRAQQTFSRAYALLGPVVDTSLVSGENQIRKKFDTISLKLVF